MKIISHRGNLDGSNSDSENKSSQARKALDLGFHVEIDVWVIYNNIYLGHDYPKYPVTETFLLSDGFICHAKNLAALEYMLDRKIHCFWHEDDDYTMTSKGIPVVHCGKTPVSNSIWVELDLKSTTINDLWGICTDYPIQVQQSIEK